MTACVFHGPGKVAVEKIPKPEVGPGDVLMQVKATSICASDIRVFKGEKSARKGVIQGHEVAGVVAEVGSEVAGYSVGEAITVCPILACGRCYFCMIGRRNRCASRTTLGYDENGGLSEYMLIPQQLVELGHILKVPAGLPLEIASMTEPFACALYSLEVCQVGAGSSLLIVGAGPMGLTHLLIGRALGCSTIIVSDLMDSRLQAAQSLGADLCLDPTRQDVKKAVLEATAHQGADAVIITVGNVEAIGQGLDAVRKEGYVNLFGGFPPGARYVLDPNLIHYNEVVLTGTQNATPDHYRRALSLLTIMPKAKDLITHRFHITEAVGAFEARLALEGLKSVVTFE